MKKLLLICLVGLLCLPMSTLTAQVADSPGADFLHRSRPSVPLGLRETHRGGETRSDTFLPGNFGLVDSDQDFASNRSSCQPSATNQERHVALYLELDGGPTPRLKSNHPSAVQMAGKPEKQQTRMAKIPSAEIYTTQVADSPPETDLVDYSGLPAGNRIADFSVNDQKVGIPGQEGESSSASVGEAAPVVIYGEIRGDVDSDQVEAKIYSNLLDVDANIPAALQVNQKLVQGHLFSGNIGLKTFEILLPMEGEMGYADIKVGKAHLVDMFLVAPGDSIRIHVDLQNGRTVYNGPSADSFRAQAEIQLKIDQERLAINPIMLTPDKSSFLSREEDALRYNNLTAAYQKGWSKQLEFLDSGELIYKYIAYQMGDVTDLTGFWRILDKYHAQLNPAIYDVLRADVIGRSQLRRLNVFFRNLRPEERYAHIFDSYLASMYGEESLPSQAYFYGEYLFLLASIQAKIDGESLIAASGALPQEQKEIVLAKSIAKNFRRIPDLHKSVEAVLQQVKTPWISQELNLLISRQSAGSAIPHISFEDRGGNAVFPVEWKGKVVVLDLWLVGCKSCAGFFKERLLPLYKEFGDREDFLIATVAVDKDRENWIKGMESGNYTDPGFTNLYASGYDHPFLDHYKIGAFPTYMLIGKDGKILKSGDFPKELSGWMHIIENYLSTDPTHTGI